MSDATPPGQDSVQPPHCSLQPPDDLEFFPHVSRYVSSRQRFPDHFERYVQQNLPKWPWYCSICLEQKTWADFERKVGFWPYSVCDVCRQVFRSTERPYKIRCKHRKAGHRTIVRLPDALPTAIETMIAVCLQQMGGINGFADLIVRILKIPDITEKSANRRAKLCRSLLRAMERQTELELEKRKAEATEFALKSKSVSKFSDQDLRDALGPMLIEMLRKRPDVGVAALRDHGWVMGDNAKNLACQIKKQDKAYQQRLMRELMKDS